LGKCKALLDVGGGSGGFSLTLAQQWPDLHCTVLDFPNVCKVGEEFVSAAGMDGRVEFLPGNALKVRRTPSWPRSWANFSLFCLYSHRNVWANSHLLGQPNSFLA
jgi:hypothetical protein